MKVIEGMLEKKVIEPVRSAARAVFALGISLGILGMLSMLSPLVTGMAVQAVVGVLTIAAGVMWVMFAFHAKSWGSGLWEALVGVLAVITGVLMLSYPLVSLAVLTLVLASYFIATGILRAIFAFRLKPVTGWGWVLFSGLVSILLGALITHQWPLSGLWAIGTLLGVDMIFGGGALISLASSTEELVRRQ